MHTYQFRHCDTCGWLYTTEVGTVVNSCQDCLDKAPKYPLVKPSTIYDFRHDLIIYYAKCVVNAKKRMERFPEDRYFVLSYNDYVIRLGYWLGEVTTDVFQRMTEYWHQERMALLSESIKKSEMVGKEVISR